MAAGPAAYQVLARKYRPHAFDDLFGQEAMVRTLTNAFATGRIAHAFMLTGVRGVGKTTTARLLARALNYETDDRPPAVDRPANGRGRALPRHHRGPAHRTCWSSTPPPAPASTRCASCWTACAMRR